MCKTILPLILLVETDAWQYGKKTKLTFYIFCLAPCSKTFPRDCPKISYFELKSSKVVSFWGLLPHASGLRRLEGFALRFPLPPVAGGSASGLPF